MYVDASLQVELVGREELIAVILVWTVYEALNWVGRFVDC